MLSVGDLKNQRPAKVSPGGPAYVLGGTSMRLGRFGNRNFGRETLNFSLRIISCNFGFLAALSSCSHLQKKLNRECDASSVFRICAQGGQRLAICVGRGGTLGSVPVEGAVLTKNGDYLAKEAFVQCRGPYLQHLA